MTDHSRHFILSNFTTSRDKWMLRARLAVGARRSEFTAEARTRNRHMVRWLNANRIDPTVKNGQDSR